MRSGLCVVFCLVAAIAVATEAAEETLYLHSGGQLSGRSVAVENGQVRWEVAPHRELLIPVEWVERLEVAPPVSDPPVAPDIVGLESTLASAASAPLEGSRTWFETVDWFDNLREWSGESLAAFEYWSRRVQVGGQFLDGNTQSDLLDVITELEKGTPTQMRQVDIGGQWARNQNRQTANRWFMNSNFDWPVREASQWITFISSKNEYNALQNLDYRGTISSGGGYRFFFEPRKRLIARFGPAFTVELFHHPIERRYTPDLFGEVEIRWPVRPRLQVEEKFRVQPSLLDFELVRVFSTTGLIWDLDEKDRWKLRLGLQYNYNSQPNTGRVPSDYVSTLSLVYLRK